MKITVFKKHHRRTEIVFKWINEGNSLRPLIWSAMTGRLDERVIIDAGSLRAIRASQIPPTRHLHNSWSRDIFRADNQTNCHDKSPTRRFLANGHQLGGFVVRRWTRNSFNWISAENNRRLHSFTEKNEIYFLLSFRFLLGFHCCQPTCVRPCNYEIGRRHLVGTASDFGRIRMSPDSATA